MVPICNVLAYLLGPIALAEPPWMAIGVTVAAVLLLTARETLHGFARRLDVNEIVTAGKFLVLSGLVLPFLPNEPVTRLTDITPYQVWLAVLAVCSISYASYLLRRYVAPAGVGLWVAVLGGLYSSTATSIVLARRARAEPAIVGQMQTGIILATAIMYVRVLVIIALFNLPLAERLGPALLSLSVLGLALASMCYWLTATPAVPEEVGKPPTNPLELTAALIFAIFFVVISVAAAWARTRFGERGLFALAAIVGATDIDPFVLGIAAGGTAPLPAGVSVAAILIAASANNLAKAGYVVGFAGVRTAATPIGALGLLALGGGSAAWWIATGTG
jgi:uncharacterized membrane protein (DUF4010 family)